MQDAVEGLSTQACTKTETVFSMLKEIHRELRLALMSSCCKRNMQHKMQHKIHVILKILLTYGKQTSK